MQLNFNLSTTQSGEDQKPILLFMTPRFITQQFPIIGLIGIVAAYWFGADAIPGLAMFSDVAVIVENPLMVRGFYLTLSFLITILEILLPAKLTFIPPLIFLLIFSLAILIPSVIAVFTASFWLIALMIGAEFKISPLIIDWVLILGCFIAPVMFLNAVTAQLVSVTAKSLGRYSRLKQWEMIVLLIGVSWLGLALGWGL